MAKIFLEAGSDVNYPVGDDSSVYGTASATDSILIGNNVEGIVADQNVEKILLEGNSSTYRYQQWGNTVKIYSADGSVLIGSAAVQADGTDLVFSNGKVAVTLVDGVMKFGGTVVNDASPTVLDPVTIDTTETSTGAGGITGTTYTLTTLQDTVPGTTGNDVIKGIFGAAGETVTAGDDVNGGDGIDTMELTTNGTGASSPAFFVENVEKISIVDLYGATFDATSVLNDPSISYTNTQTGLTSKVVNASLGSVVGLAGKGNLTVDYLTTSGTADTAKLSLSGTGTSATVRSTVDVSDTNTVEAVNIATTGSNFVTLNGGTKAATVTVTGDGTNNFDISAAGAVAGIVTVDASTSTGANTFMLGNTLTTLDVIKGGTAADTINSTFTSATLVKPTLTGVETIQADFDAAAVLNLGLSTGVQTVTLKGSLSHQSIVEADASLATVNVQSQDFTDAVENTLEVSHRAATPAPLTINIGSTTTTVDADFSLADITLGNVNATTINTIGTHAHSGGAVDINMDQTALSINVGADTDLDLASVNVDGAIGALNIAVGALASYSGAIYSLNDSGIGDVTMSVGSEGDLEAWIEVSGGGNIGNVTLTATGFEASGDAMVFTDHGNIGDITLEANGEMASVDFSATASGGTIGNITFNVIGTDASGNLGISAGDWEGAGSGISTAGAVGNVNISVDGNSAWFSGAIDVSGGDIGNVSFSVAGTDASGSLTLAAMYEVRDIEGTAGVNDYAFGGNIGDITLIVDGDDAQGELWATTSGGSIGNITISVDGANASGLMYVSANSLSYSGAPADGGNIGNIDISIGAGASFSGSFDSDGGSVGDVSITATGADASGCIEIDTTETSGMVGGVSGYYHGGDIGNITINIDGGAGTELSLNAAASGGNIGIVDYTLTGAQASGDITLAAQYVSGNAIDGGHGGNIGAMTFAFGDNLDFDGQFFAAGSIGAITITGGESVSAFFGISGAWATGDLDMSERQIGDVSIDMGKGTDMLFAVSGWDGGMGNITATFGEGSDAELNVTGISGDVGNIAVTAGINSVVFIHSSGGDTGTDFGTITLAGGNVSSSAGVYISDTTEMIHSVANVDATAWAGELAVDLEGVTIGTLIQVGTGGSWVRGTEGGDNIFLGAGVDMVSFDTTPTAVDTIGSFTTGAGKDSLDLIAGVGALGAVLTVNPGATVLADNAISRLVDIAGGQDITTAAGLLAALNGGEYDGLAATAGASDYTFVTAASAAATQFYVFHAVETADANFDSVTLIGVVNASGALSTLDITNFA